MQNGGQQAQLARERREKEKRRNAGKMKCERDRDVIVEVKSDHLLRLFQFHYLLCPMAPNNALLQRLFLNLSSNKDYREVIVDSMVLLLSSSFEEARRRIFVLDKDKGKDNNKDDNKDDNKDNNKGKDSGGSAPDLSADVCEPLPDKLLGVPVNSMGVWGPRTTDGSRVTNSLSRNLPVASLRPAPRHLPALVGTRLVDSLFMLAQNSRSCCRHLLGSEWVLERLLGLLDQFKNSRVLEQLLGLIEVVCTPLANLPVEAGEGGNGNGDRGDRGERRE